MIINLIKKNSIIIIHINLQQTKNITFNYIIQLILHTSSSMKFNSVGNELTKSYFLFHTSLIILTSIHFLYISMTNCTQIEDNRTTSCVVRPFQIVKLIFANTALRWLRCQEGKSVKYKLYKIMLLARGFQGCMSYHNSLDPYSHQW